MSVRRYSDLTLYRRFMDEARPYWPRLAVLGLLDLLQVPLVLLQPLSLKIIVDNVLDSQPLPAFVDILLPTTSGSWQSILAFALVLGFGVTFLEKSRGFASWVLRVRIGEQLATGFKAKLFHHLQRLSLTYHDTIGTADSMYRVDRDADAIKKIVSGLTPYLVASATLAGMLYMTLQMDWQLSLVALAGSPIAMILIATQRRRVRERWNAIYEHQSRALSVVQEVLAAVRVVKAFGREEREQGRFAQHSERSVQGQVGAAVYEAGLDVAIGLLFSLSAMTALLIGVWHIQDGRLTLGELLVVMTYLGNLYGPLEVLSRFSSDLQSSFAAAARVCTVLDEEPEIVDRPHARTLVRASGAVTFRSVSFSYGSAGPALHRLSFEIPPGARVGIVGPTGAGKTTLVNLLARFYDPTRGEVLLDGVDLRDYRVSDLRKQFAMVLQEPILFSTSISENIAYARPDATSDEIVAAARAANADAFISALPEGYDTPVGERGMRLSGGERQRISLARAFLKDAPILILDEPTSSVDVATEAQIMESMQRLMRGRTAFLIAHRLSTLDVCDLRLELDHGRLISFAPTGEVHHRASGLRT